MGEPLFDLACRLGWLNLVDREAKTDEAVYAFFHPTFQEYFAACAIDDCRYFLNHDNENSNPLLNPNPSLEYDNGKPGYRIFEPQWKEVILLWLGREGSEDFRKQKEEFIEALIGFEDGCREWFFGYKGFYEYRSYLLAATGIAEFRKCNCADEIVKQLVKWSFGEFNVRYQAQQTFVHRQIAEEAKVTLLDTHHSLAVNALIGFLHTEVDEYTRIEAAEILGKIVSGHPEAIATLLEIMHNSLDQGCREQAVESLGKVAKGNRKVIVALDNLIHSNPNEFIGHIAAESLWQIDPGHSKAISVVEYSALYSTCFQDAVKSGNINPNKPEWIACLVDKIRNPTDERERLWAVQHLKASDTSTPEASAALIDLIRSNPDEDTLREAARSLGRIGKSDPEATDLLIDLSYNSPNRVISKIAIQGLSYTDTNPEKVINALIELISTRPDQQIRSAAAQSLGQILQRYPLGSAVSTLKNTLPAQINNNNHFKLNFNLYRNCYDVLLNCAQNMPYPDFYQAWHQTTTHQRG
jgi:HEAT repeat protein